MASDQAFVLPVRNKHIKWSQCHMLKYSGIRDTTGLIENVVLNKLKISSQ